jgi:hypothetical protein
MKPSLSLGRLFLFGSCLLLFILLMATCSTVYPEAPLVTGKMFPVVSGEDLNGEEVNFSSSYWSLNSRPTVVLVGYEQDSQFDCDRWILGLLQLRTPVNIIELPTIPGLIPRIISGTIDSGMRSGIPSQDWGSVVTLYGESATDIKGFLGNNKASNAYVNLVDSSGEIMWSHHRGYSASLALELDALARSIGVPID